MIKHQRYCDAIEIGEMAVITKCDDGLWRIREWDASGWFGGAFTTRAAARLYASRDQNLGCERQTIVKRVDIEPAPATHA